jgi:hypothetical protein
MSGKRIIRSYSKELPSPPETVFPLLCPVREYDWIPDWNCEIIYTKSGYAELGCVFTTDFNDHSGLETWVVCLYETNRQIGFVKTGQHATSRYTVSLDPNQTGSIIKWKQEITSLDKHGDLLLDNITETAYYARMEHTNKLLEYYLLHGVPLNDKEFDSQ